MAKEYTVRKMRPQFRLTDEGELEKFYRVSAMTKGGILFEIDVPDTSMQPDQVKPLLAEKAKTLDEIKAL